jgi:hypothetical protein
MAEVKQFVRRTVGDLTHPIFVKQMIWVILFAILSVVVILTNMDFLQTAYPVAARPDDFLLDRIPETEAFIQLSDIIGRAGALIIIYIMWEEHFKRAPKLIFLLALMYVMRSFAIILTPLAQIHPPAETYSEGNVFMQSFYHGMFFSGHAASAFLQVFFIKGHWLRPLAIAIAIFESFALIASHSHYSIDIFGGFFVAFFFVEFDFMYFVPMSIRNITWMPWYTGESDQETKRLPA